MAFLRTGWRHGDTLLALNNIRQVTCHGHNDRASVILEFNGEQLLLDPGMIGYEDPNSNQYQKTFCHNTITFDQRDQLGGTDVYDTAIAGFLSLSGDKCPGIKGSLDWVIADSTAVYPEAVRFVRHVIFLRPSVFVLIDEVEAKEPETIALNFTCLGPLSGEGERFISTTQRNRLLIHSQATAPLTTSLKNWGTHWPEIPSYRLIRATAQTTERCTFLTVLAPSSVETPPATVEVLQGGGLGVRVMQATQQATVAVRTGTGMPDMGGVESDAQVVALNRVNQRLRSAAMLDGTFLRTMDDGELLRADAPGLSGAIR